MKIAVVIPKYGLVGGAEGFAYEVTERLAERDGLDIHLFANQWRSGNTSITFHKVPIIPFPRFMRPISFAYFAQKSIKKGDYDIIHSHDRVFRMDLFTMHCIPHKTWIKEARHKQLSLFDRSMAWVEEKALKGLHILMVLPVSNLVKDELLKVYDIPESKIRVIHPGISKDRFSIFERETCRSKIRYRHGLSPSDIVVLFVGMNFEIKRLELIMRGIAGLGLKRSSFYQVKLLVVGKGDTGRYRVMARHLGIADRVIFAGVTRQVEKYYLASDIFAMPSVFDTFGIAALEAMMASLPVIISRRVGARDLIDPGVQGFVLPDDPSPSDMTEALAVLMEREKRVKMGQNGRQVALKYDWNRTADQVASLYRMLGNKRRC